MNNFTINILLTRRFSSILVLAFGLSFTSLGQTPTILAPGDIMVLQIDEGNIGADRFLFVTFVDLSVGTTIYFTDCGVFPAGSFTDVSNHPNYTSCPEGATKFVVSSPAEAGTIFQYIGGQSGGTQFSPHTDNLITGSIDFTYNGDQVIVFQDAANPGGSAQPSANPAFIFALNGNDGNFNSTPLPSSADQSGTSVPSLLNTMNSPAGSATALAVGTGNGEFDNIVFNGTGLIPFMGSTLAEKITNAKIAILATPGATNQSNGMNWLGEDNTSTNPLYADYENLLINSVNILPVELTSFQARPKVKSIDLQWVTASETNNDYFAVEKSTNGIDFEELTEIDGKGTTILESYYNWIDRSPNNGLNYYRLLQVDFDGVKSYSNILAIEFKSDRDKIQLYPNPVILEVNINLPENWKGESLIILHDFYGRLINSFTVSSGSVTFPVDNIPSGFYRISATNNSKNLNTTFIKR